MGVLKLDHANINRKGLVAILSLWATLSDFSILTPALDSLAKAFPDTPYSTILFSNTVTGLLIVVVAVVSGRFVERVGYRKMAISGLVLATLCGCYPFFLAGIEDYTPIVISRILVGIGIGMVTPIGGTLLSRYFEGKQRAKFFGVGNLVFVGGGVLFQLAGGFLASVSWNVTFLGYLLSVVPLVLVILFLPEPKAVSRQKSKRRTGEKRLPPIIFAYVVLEVCLATIDIPALFATSSVVAVREMGSPALAGILTSLYQLSGIFAGAVFAALLGVFNKKIFSFAAFVCALGYLVMLVAHNPLLYGLGMLLLGIGDLVFFTAVQYAANNATPKEALASTNGLMMAAMNLGAFFASYYLMAVQAVFPEQGFDALFLSSAVLLGLVGLVCAFSSFRHISGLGDRGKE